MNWIVDASVVDDNQLRDRRSHNRQPHDRRLPDFRLQGRMTGLVVPTLFLAIVCGSVAPSHASLLDWLFPNRSRRAQPQVVAMVPVGGNGVPTSPIASSGAMATYGYPGIGTAPVNWSAGSPYSAQASVVGGGYAPIAGYQASGYQVAGYAPQTAYRTVWARVPVTSYQPVACSTGSCMRPCTTYSWQARRVPYITYQPTYGYNTVGYAGNSAVLYGVQPAAGAIPPNGPYHFGAAAVSYQQTLPAGPGYSDGQEFSPSYGIPYGQQVVPAYPNSTYVSPGGNYAAQSTEDTGVSSISSGPSGGYQLQPADQAPSLSPTELQQLKPVIPRADDTRYQLRPVPSVSNSAIDENSATSLSPQTLSPQTPAPAAGGGYTIRRQTTDVSEPKAEVEAPPLLDDESLFDSIRNRLRGAAPNDASTKKPNGIEAQIKPLPDMYRDREDWRREDRSLGAGSNGEGTGTDSGFQRSASRRPAERGEPEVTWASVPIDWSHADSASDVAPVTAELSGGGSAERNQPVPVFTYPTVYRQPVRTAPESDSQPATPGTSIRGVPAKERSGDIDDEGWQPSAR